MIDLYQIYKRSDKRNNELGSPPNREVPKSTIDLQGVVRAKIVLHHNILLFIHLKNFYFLIDIMNIECP